MELTKPIVGVLCVVLGFGLGAATFLATDSSGPIVADLRQQLTRTKELLEDSKNEQDSLKVELSSAEDKRDSFAKEIAKIRDGNAVLARAEKAEASVVTLQRKVRDQEITLDLKQDTIDGILAKLKKLQQQSSPATTSGGTRMSLVRVANKHKSDVPSVVPKLSVRVLERNTGYDVHTWQLTLTNTGRRAARCTATLKWLDSEGFLLEDTYGSINESVPPGGKQVFSGTTHIDKQHVDRVYEVAVEISE